MYFYTWSDVVMAARVFHTTNVGELAEAIELDHEDQHGESTYSDDREIVTPAE